MRVDNLKLKIASLIAFVLVCLGTFAYLFTQAGGRFRTHTPYTVSALVPDPLNIVENSDVREDGVKTGRVRKIEPSGQVSKITFEIENKKQAQFYRDATVAIRTKTLVGESYVDVNPGRPSSGKLNNGATIPLTQANEIAPLERILSTLDYPTRVEVRRNLRGLGVGLKGEGQNLNRVFGALKPTVADGGVLMRVLKPQREELAGLIGNTGQVLEALGERQQQFRTLATTAKLTAEAAASRDAKLSASFEQLPSTLKQAQTSVNKLNGFAGRATPTFRTLKLASGDLGPAVRDLAPAARDARTLFKELRPFIKVANPLLSELDPATTKLRTVIPPLDAFLRQTQPLVAYLEPYKADITGFFSNAGSIFTTDALGQKGRVFAMSGLSSIAGVPPAVGKLLSATLDTTKISSIAGKPRLNPYARPNTAGDPQSYDNSFTRVQPLGG